MAILSTDMLLRDTFLPLAALLKYKKNYAVTDSTSWVAIFFTMHFLTRAKRKVSQNSQSLYKKSKSINDAKQ